MDIKDTINKPLNAFLQSVEKVQKLCQVGHVLLTPGSSDLWNTLHKGTFDAARDSIAAIDQRLQNEQLTSEQALAGITYTHEFVTRATQAINQWCHLQPPGGMVSEADCKKLELTVAAINAAHKKGQKRLVVEPAKFYKDFKEHGFDLIPKEPKTGSRGFSV